MDPFDTTELVETIVHQAHVIRRLEVAVAQQARQIAALEAKRVPLASADERTDTDSPEAIP
jgi:hypothetical protein